jgi:oxepin-CoA hydrolase/3-oxo-5,6-dehydrosuberyl-CoA semialdehyde dehydrogenase
VLASYASRAKRELPDDNLYVEGPVEQLGKGGHFLGQHLMSPLQGVAVQINAFNFPVWGPLEKFAPSFVAGVPSVIKPASQTAYLTQKLVELMLASQLLPEGSLQLICGPAGDLLDCLQEQDSVYFTGSAATGHELRAHPNVVRRAVRFNLEADSLNCSILGPDASPGTSEFDLFLGQVVTEMTVKAGQKCTAIRRTMVPRELLSEVAQALRGRLDEVVIGDPRNPEVHMGALASSQQLTEVRSRVAELLGAGKLCYGDPEKVRVEGGDPEKGAFMSPIVVLCEDPWRSEPHEIEAFGPVTTLLPYDSTKEAVRIASLGRGSLAGSVVSADREFCEQIVKGLAPWHGRILVLDRDSAPESTGHGSPLPVLIHGGPGRAGGGEEMGGIRGVLRHMQRCAIEASPAALEAVTGSWVPGADRHSEGVHPFRKALDTLSVGDTITAGPRKITLEDIEHFAQFTGDTFYAHMNEEAAKANPFFGRRVAHGYLVVSFAAGLFVDPDPGPVLANYGLENLRFLTPVYPDDEISVTLTCKQISPRLDADYGEVRWDAQVTNQSGEVVARYDVLTLVAKHWPIQEASKD